MRAQLLVMASIVMLTATGWAERPRQPSRARLLSSLHAKQETIYKEGAGCTAFTLAAMEHAIRGGARYTAGRKGIVIREDWGSWRMKSRAGGGVVITSRHHGRGNLGPMVEREVTTPLGGGLATSTTTGRYGNASETRHNLGWKNSTASIPAELSSSQIAQLKTILGSPLNRLKAALRAGITYHDRRAVGAMELKQALDRLGVKHSVDWR